VNNMMAAWPCVGRFVSGFLLKKGGHYHCCSGIQILDTGVELQNDKAALARVFVVTVVILLL